MNVSSLAPIDYARKAVAPIATCVYVADSASAGSLKVLIYALKDLQNAGIFARLVIGGQVGHQHEHDLLELAHRLGFENLVHLVRDTGEFTLSRVYLFSQYLLSLASTEDAQVTRDAVRHGCIPIRHEGSDRAFFDQLERVIRSTFNNPAAYAAMHEQVTRTMGG